MRFELLEGMAAHVACGFHTARWADAFSASCDDVLGRRPSTFVSSLAPDPDDIGGVAASERCQHAQAGLDADLAGRRLIARVDRIELSKNLLRGFAAYDDLLRRYPEWREEVVFGAFVYPSREGLRSTPPTGTGWRGWWTTSTAAGPHPAGRPCSTTTPTTSPGPSRASAATTCCW